MENKKNIAISKIAILAIFISISSVIQVVENILVPSPAPFKLGLANVVTLIALALFGFKEALAVAVIRVFLAGIITGKLFGLPFILGLAGGIAAAVVMALFYNKSVNLSIIGVSIIGSISHGFAQMGILYLFFLPNSGIFHLIPWIWGGSLITGIFTGFVAKGIIESDALRKSLKPAGILKLRMKNI